jgi:hypothetical protein
MTQPSEPVGPFEPDPDDPRLQEALAEMDCYAAQGCQRLILEHRLAGLQGSPAGGYTYRQLRDYLNTLAELELDQTVQLFTPRGTVGAAARLRPVVGAGTVAALCHVDGAVVTPTRNAHDFQHHPEQVVLVADLSPFSAEGDRFYTLEPGGLLRGDATGKVHRFGRRAGAPDEED